jgi:hypothetical protein
VTPNELRQVLSSPQAVRTSTRAAQSVADLLPLCSPAVFPLFDLFLRWLLALRVSLGSKCRSPGHWRTDRGRVAETEPDHQGSRGGSIGT